MYINKEQRLTFLEFYTWLMLRNGGVWGWAGVGDVNVPELFTWWMLRDGCVWGWVHGVGDVNVPSTLHITQWVGLGLGRVKFLHLERK